MRSFRLLPPVILLIVMIFASGYLFTAPVSRAATFTIPCNDVSALINAITTANSNGESDTIELAAACTYTLTAVHNITTGPNGLPAIVIDGSSANTLTINGNGATLERAIGSPPFRFLQISGTFTDDLTLTINDLTFRNGDMNDEEGGAIQANYARLTLNRVTFANNQATNDGGAVVARNSELTLNRTVFENNRALTVGSAEGGALYTVSATTIISDSIFRNNRSERSGGAITFRVDGPGAATITGTTFSDNQTTGEGGAIAVYHDITLRNSTFSGNRAGADGGALFSDMNARLEHVTITGTQTGGNGALYGAATLQGSLIAGNTDTSPGGGANYPDIADLFSSLSSDGYNLIGNVGDYDFNVNTTGDRYGDPLGTTTPNTGATESSTPIDPLLAPLADNGGSAPTHALTGGSPALDQIPAGSCNVTTDQRGIARPQPTGGACDIGAFEAVHAPEIAVYDSPDASGPELTNNQATVVSFGTTPVGTPVARIFAIRNPGITPLTLGALTLPTGFAVIGAFPGEPVAPGATITFTVQLTAATAGIFSGTLSFVNGDADENPFQFPISGTVTVPAPSTHMAYLPLVMRPGQPDLTITSIAIIPNQTTFAAGQPIEIQITVQNIGSAPAGPFWVDLYLNPDRPPQINDLWHDHCALRPCFGVAWGVTRILQPGEQITLSTGSGYDTLRTYWLGWLANGTTTIYALADSWNVTGVTGAVFESDETNNRGVRDGLVVGGTNPPAPPWTPAYFAGSAQSLLLPARPAYARSDRNAPR